MPVLTSRANEYQLVIHPWSRGADKSAGAKIGEEWRRLDFTMVSIEDDFSDGLGLLLCFLCGHFAMFGHGLIPF